MAARAIGFTADLCLALLWATPLLGEMPSRLVLPIGHPLKVETALPARRTFVPMTSIDMRVIAEVEGTRSYSVALGDTDHDGRNEVIIIGGSTCSFRILEAQEDNSYSLEYVGECLQPYAAGDLDRDGKSDLVVQSGGFIQVYESPDEATYPTQLSWSSEYLSNVVGDATVGDTDRDGRMEIIHSQNYLSASAPSVLLIYENTGDNSFTLAFADTIFGSGAIGQKAIADFDRDGLVEIAFSGLLGRTYVYESPSDNTWRRIWSTSRTGFYVGYATAVGMDTDDNGKTELFVMGNDAEGWTTIVFEPSSDDIFETVATVSVADGFVGDPFNAIVNLDNLGSQEYVMDTDAGLWIYEARSPGRWNLVNHIPDPGPTRAHNGIHPYDLNQNGRAELIWTGGPTTLFLEYRSGVSSVGESQGRRPGQLFVFPNPCGQQTQLQVTFGSSTARWLSIFDVAGRVVERRLLGLDAQGQNLWPTNNLASGVYLLRLESANGQPLATGRATIVR